jgi:hypothetical protein
MHVDQTIAKRYPVGQRRALPRFDPPSFSIYMQVDQITAKWYPGTQLRSGTPI